MIGQRTARARHIGFSIPQRSDRIVLGLLLAVLVLFLFRIAWPFAASLLLGSILAIVLQPANDRLVRRLRRPALASLLTTLAGVFFLQAVFLPARLHYAGAMNRLHWISSSSSYPPEPLALDLYIKGTLEQLCSDRALYLSRAILKGGGTNLKNRGESFDFKFLGVSCSPR